MPTMQWPALLLLPVVLARKNVLFLVSDDMRPNLGAYLGPDFPSPVYPVMHTPTLDSLAKRSLLLKRAYVSQALCNPSRTALLTSRRPDTSHIYAIGPYFRKYGGNFTTLPEYFKKNGYRTIGMGKVFHPGKSSGNDDPVSWTDPYFHAPDKYAKDDLIWQAVSEEREAQQPLQDSLLADNAIKVLQEVAPKAKSGEQPFFVAVGLHRPHLPWNFPARFMEYYPLENIRLPPNYFAPVGMPTVAWHNFTNMGRYKNIKPLGLKDVGNINFTFPHNVTLELRRAYYSCMSFTDYELGRVIAELDNLGLSNNTIISFWGDHGWQLGEHSEWEKQTNFEDATHAPMMIHIPGLTDQGIVTEQFTEFVDLFPTLAEAAELPKIETCPEHSQNVTLCTEGLSLMPLVKNPNTTLKTAAFSQYHRDGDPLTGKAVMGYTMRTDTYRYTEWVKFTGGKKFVTHWNKLVAAELYDHTVDPQENYNQALNVTYASIRKVLSAKLRAGWRKAIPGGETLSN
ncbi:iduronate 2-sulfatase-like [Haliotis asinina]|uniref:iduronate 2-sulfatase-like n=1 Tax=Haliotis asinina TaxID=109174 RepID=UPI003531FF02